MPEKKHRFRSAEVCGDWCVECRFVERVLPLSFLGGVLFFLFYFLTIGAPLTFPAPSYVRVSEGQSVREVGEELAEKHIIRWPLLFSGAVRVFGDNQKVVAGEYFFSSAQNLLTVARRLANGDFELTPVRVTIMEGSTARQITDILGEKIPDFDSARFLGLAQDKEGYLFPDTYFIYPGEFPETVIAQMTNNFDAKIAQASTTIEASGRTVEELVIMASLLEKEAPDLESRRMIAGVLWERIRRGMPLQVDAVFPYILGKNTFEVTLEDLQVDSPYNTYKYKGLPVGAIANPSFTSILAAATPKKSNYLFYLSDLDGNFHYSTTYEQHLRYKARYLD